MSETYTVVLNYTCHRSGQVEELMEEFASELEAVRRIREADLHENLEWVSYSPNIDRSAYRF